MYTLGTSPLAKAPVGPCTASALANAEGHPDVHTNVNLARSFFEQGGPTKVRENKRERLYQTSYKPDREA